MEGFDSWQQKQKQTRSNASLFSMGDQTVITVWPPEWGLTN